MSSVELTSELEASILDAVDQRFDQQVAFTQELMRYPSQRGQEHTAQECMYKAMRTRGLAMDRFAIDVDDIRDHPGFSPVAVSYANAINVVGTHTPVEATGRSLILNGYIDVVPTGPLDMWSVPPYEPALANGWLHGRGAGDMKAAGRQPVCARRPPCSRRALACLTQGYRADCALTTEPMNDTLVRANVGVIWFQVEVRGRPTHVCESSVGASAISATYKIIHALESLESEWNAQRGEHRYFEDATKPITINVGKFEGGDWASSVPAW